MTKEYKDFKHILKKPWLLTSYILIKSPISHFLSAKMFLSHKYHYKTEKHLNINTPQSFNEKLQWLKLYYHDNRMPLLVDKLAVRKYVEYTIGVEYLIPLIGTYDVPNQINFETLPNSFVLKTTHDSGGVIICPNKTKLDTQKAIHTLNKSRKTNFYYSGREWPYKNIIPKIICEKYMTDESGIELKDYKIFCFSGKAKLIQVDFDRFTSHKRNLFDLEWNLLPYAIEFPSDQKRKIPKPTELKKMICIAEKLSADFPHVRVDLYVIGSAIYFGEMTFFHGSGWEKFYPETFNMIMGSYISLPKIESFSPIINESINL